MSLCLQNGQPDVGRLPEGPQRRLGLTPLDKLAAMSFATGDVTELLEQVRTRAELLSGPDGQGLRLRMISKRLATCEVHVELLEVLVGKALAGRDWEGLRNVELLLRTVTGRLLLLRREHAEEVRQGHRPTVVVRREYLSAEQE